MGKLCGEDKMFKIFRLLQNVADNVVSLSELKTKDGKTSMDLAESSDTEGMLEVLRDERKEYVEQNEKSHVQTETAREVVKESEVKDDKPVDGGKINDDEVRALIYHFINANILFSDQS